MTLANDDTALYRAMLRIRLVEETIAGRYGEQEMRCPVHLSVGQEALAVGVCSALTPRDRITSTHRCHAHYLAKGGGLRPMLAEIYGKAAGCCGGRGGSMHLFDDDVGVVVSLPIVSSSIPLAAGLALAMKQEGRDTVAAAFFGDGAAEEGVLHETMNFAALKRLPMLFVLENNLYSVYTPLEDRQPPRPLTALAAAHGMPAIEGDGNDVRMVRTLARHAVERARAGGGPSLLVLHTYRWLEHCGPGYDNDIGYRDPAEFEGWKLRCPIATFRRRLVEEGALTVEEDGQILEQLAAEIGEAFSFAREAPFPEPVSAEAWIYG